MKKHILVGLSTISIPLAAMNKSENTWVLQPTGGYLVLHPYVKEDVCKFYSDDNVEKTVHFTPVNCNDTKHPIYQFLKYGMRPTVPLQLFTEEGKSYTITTKDTGTFTVVSDQIYNAENFDSSKDYWENIHSKKYSYEQYMKKIRNDQ